MIRDDFLILSDPCTRLLNHSIGCSFACSVRGARVLRKYKRRSLRRSYLFHLKPPRPSSLCIQSIGYRYLANMAQAQASGSSALASDEAMYDQTAHPDSKTAIADVDDKFSNAASYEHMQDGVKQAEALTMAWTKKSLGLAYAL